jgi:hypothetical protein
MFEALEEAMGVKFRWLERGMAVSESEYIFVRGAMVGYGIARTSKAGRSGGMAWQSFVMNVQRLQRERSEYVG